MGRATERIADAIAPTIRPVLMTGNVEQRTCQVARWLHGQAGMCICRVCVSQRIFLRILALLVA